MDGVLSPGSTGNLVKSETCAPISLWPLWTLRASSAKEIDTPMDEPILRTRENSAVASVR